MSKKNLTNNSKETKVVAANTNNNMSKEDNNTMKNTTNNNEQGTVYTIINAMREANASELAEAGTTGVKFFGGNLKVGDMLTFNKLAGDIVFNGCRGTCTGHCTGCWESDNWKKSDCYVANSYNRYQDHVINAHIKNTIPIRERIHKAFDELNNILKRKRTFKPVRIHASGELETVTELWYHLWLAKENPQRMFYIYTKGFEFIDEVLQTLEDNGEELPENFFLNISIWHEHGIDCYHKWEHFKNVRAFACDDEEFDYEAAGLHINGKCPAYRKNEKDKVIMDHNFPCDKCKICFQRKAKVIACLKH